MRPILTLALLLVTSAPSILPASPPLVGPAELVADLETAPLQVSSQPGVSVELGGAVLFTARNDRHGLALWRTDGTAEGTRELADLAPGSAPVGVSPPVLFDGHAALVVTVGGGRRDLWVSDGTVGGTRLVAHLPIPSFLAPPGPASVPVALGDRIYFAARDPDLSSELWVSDGTAAGTHMLVDLCPGACTARPQEVAAVGDRLHVTTLAFPGRLWVSDGTAAGTRTLDICPGGCASPPGDLVAHGNLLLFRVDDGIHGLEPWVSDGTAAGTRLLADLNPGPGPSGANLVTGFFSLGGVLYFTAQTGEDGGTRIWRTDGTPEGTVPATELLDAGRDGLPDATVEADERVFFSLEEPRPEGGSWDREVWVLDGPAQSPRRLAGFRLERRSTFRGLPLADGRVLFSAGTLDTGEELWITDGTVEGTVPVTEIRPGPAGSFPSPLGRAGERVVLAADDGVHGRELWASDGTAAGTAMVRDLLPAEASADPGHLTAHGGELYFTAGPQGPPAGEAEPRDSQLWRVAPGLAPELLVGSEARFAEIVSTGSDLYFLPPLADTLLAVQPAPAFLLEALLGLPPALRAYGELTPVGDRLFFGSQGRGQELWVTNGRPAGTRRVVDLEPGSFDPCASFPCTEGEPYFPRELTPAGARVYFLAKKTGGVPRIWRSDGSRGGTAPIPAPVVAPSALVAAGGRLVFAGLDSGGRWQLWSTDGTTPGTRLVANLSPGEFPGPTQSVGARAYVVTRRRRGTLRLWTSDGTVAGTRPVAPLGGARRFEEVTELSGAGGRLYLSLFTAAIGQELWTSDGTAAGTRPVADLWPGPGSSWPTALTPVGTFLAFAAADPAAGREPWITDGTAAGTVRLADVAPGTASSTPLAFGAVFDTLFFDTDDGDVGRELWAVKLAPGDDGLSPPPPADATPLLAPEYPGFRFWVRITSSGTVLPIRRELLCIPETVCVSGAVPGRSELFLRIVGPKPNGRLWPTLVRFSTSTIDVWIEQASTGLLRHYRLEGATRGSSDLDGRFDRTGFPPGP